MAGWWNEAAFTPSSPLPDDQGERREIAYQERLLLLARSRRELAEVRAAVQHNDAELRALDAERSEWVEKARRQVSAGEEEAARASLARAVATDPLADDLRARRESLLREEAVLQEAKAQREREVEALRAGPATSTRTKGPLGELALTSRVEQELSMLKLEAHAEGPRRNQVGRYENPPGPNAPLTDDPDLR